MSDGRFEFATSTRIVFGTPLAEIGAELAALPERVLLVTGKDPSRAAVLRELLHAQGRETHVFPVDGEPSLESARAGTSVARTRSCGAVVGMGGGSVLDLAKAIGALLTNDGDPL